MKCRVSTQLVIRWRPRLTVYVRAEPVTVRRPTPAQADARLRFGELARESKLYSVEEVAEMVGGEVVEVNGKKAIKLPDGRVLMKHQAFIKARLTGFRSQYTRVFRLPRWLSELSTTYYPAVPVRVLRAVKKSVSVAPK